MKENKCIQAYLTELNKNYNFSKSFLVFFFLMQCFRKKIVLNLLLIMDF